MVDTHCHLNFQAFEKDVDEVIKAAFKAGVTKIINVGTKLDSSQKAVELANTHENLYATVGIHPHHADKLEENWIEKLASLTTLKSPTTPNPKVVAIGECGMDFYEYASNGVADPILQEEVFIKQIELAYKLKLPLIVHNRHAGKKVIDILLDHKKFLLNLPGVFHCFSGTIELLKSALHLGFYIGFDGNITYKGLAKGETVKLEELVKFCPLDRILTETDSPYLTPMPYRGQRNEPRYVIIIANEIAKIKSLSFEEVREQTTQNANNLFNFS